MIRSELFQGLYRAKVTQVLDCPMWPYLGKCLDPIWIVPRMFNLWLQFVTKLMKYQTMKICQYKDNTVSLVVSSCWVLTKTRNLNIVELLLYVSCSQNWWTTMSHNCSCQYEQIYCDFHHLVPVLWLYWFGKFWFWKTFKLANIICVMSWHNSNGIKMYFLKQGPVRSTGRGTRKSRNLQLTHSDTPNLLMY